MNSNTQVSSGAQWLRWLSNPRTVVLISLGGLLLALLTFLWGTDSIKDADPQMKRDPYIQLHGTEKGNVKIICNQTFYNKGHGTGRVNTCEARIFPVHDDQPIGHYGASDYADDGNVKTCVEIVLSESSPSISGAFEYLQLSDHEITWKKGSYVFELSHLVESKFSFFGVKPTRVTDKSYFSLTEKEAKLINAMKKHRTKKTVTIDLLPGL